MMCRKTVYDKGNIISYYKTKLSAKSSIKYGSVANSNLFTTATQLNGISYSSLNDCRAKATKVTPI